MLHVQGYEDVFNCFHSNATSGQSIDSYSAFHTCTHQPPVLVPAPTLVCPNYKGLHQSILTYATPSLIHRYIQVNMKTATTAQAVLNTIIHTLMTELIWTRRLIVCKTKYRTPRQFRAQHDDAERRQYTL